MPVTGEAVIGNGARVGNRAPCRCGAPKAAGQNGCRGCVAEARRAQRAKKQAAPVAGAAPETPVEAKPERSSVPSQFTDFLATDTLKRTDTFGRAFGPVPRPGDGKPDPVAKAKGDLARVQAAQGVPADYRVVFCLR